MIISREVLNGKDGKLLIKAVFFLSNSTSSEASTDLSLGGALTCTVIAQEVTDDHA